MKCFWIQINLKNQEKNAHAFVNDTLNEVHSLLRSFLHVHTHTHTQGRKENFLGNQNKKFGTKRPFLFRSRDRLFGPALSAKLEGTAPLSTIRPVFVSPPKKLVHHAHTKKNVSNQTQRESLLAERDRVPPPCLLFLQVTFHDTNSV